MKGSKTVRRIILIVAVICLGSASLLFITTHKRFEKSREKLTDTQVVAKIIEDRYILHSPYTYEQLLEFSNPVEMVEALGDEASCFINKNDVAASISKLNNVYMGLGFEADKKMGKVLEIESVYPRSPALYSGLVKGDKIIRINGIDTIPMTSGDTIKLIRGDNVRDVTLTIKRGKEESDVRITRNVVEGKLVDAKMLDDKIGYLSIRAFPKDLLKSVIDQVMMLKKNGMEKLLIDVRGNHEGEVKEVAPILSMFLPYSHNVLYTVQRKNCEDERYRRSNEVIFLGPIVVLCDKWTCGCAELFLACLKELGRAEIVGDKTFGRQTTQEFYHLHSGSVLKLSNGIMYPTSGMYYEGIGIMPDKRVVMDPLMSLQGFINENEASHILRIKSIRKALEKQYGEEKINKMIEDGDIQFNAGWEILKSSPTSIYGGKNK